MSFAILGMGTAMPAAIMTQAEAERVARELCCRTAEQSTWLPTMYRHTGIDKRHLVLGEPALRDVLNHTRHSGSVFLPRYTEEDRGPTTGQRMELYAAEAGPLALQAARAALEDSRLKAGDITHLVTVSCTGFHAPGVDYELITGLGLAPTTQRTHVGYMGCHGALNGLRVARAYAEAASDCRLLLCAVELCSLHYHYGWDPQKIIANAIFADGAAAAVGSNGASAPADHWHLRASGSCIFPNSAEAMTWTIGDHGFEMTLSKKVPGLIAQNLRPWFEGWLRENDLSIADVGSWAIHPGGPKIVDAVSEALTLLRTALVVPDAVFAACGNMSSPTVLFILDELRRRQAPRPCVALAFGPGLTAEAALFG
jgi:predicted naringenin-chalcone synthase